MTSLMKAGGLAIGFPLVVLAAEQTAPTTRPAAPPTRPSAVLEPVKEGATQPAVPEAQYREGTFLVDQVGRLSHNKKGESIFIFEKDRKKQQLTLMANSNLVRMEDAAASAGSDQQFRITGMMTEYKGKNYLLVDRVVMVQAGDSTTLPN
jgi:hypothetical protein